MCDEKYPVEKYRITEGNTYSMQGTKYSTPDAILDNITGITNIYSATPEFFSSKLVSLTLGLVLITLGTVLALVSNHMKHPDDKNKLSNAGTAIFALALLCVVIAPLLSRYTSDKIPDENDIAEQLHQDILISNNFDMDSYYLEEISDFKDDGKILHWEDINSGDVSFITWHSDSSDVDHIEIVIVGEDDIRTANTEDNRSPAE